MYDIDFDPTDKIKGGYIKKFLLYPPFWIEPKNKIITNLKMEKI